MLLAATTTTLALAVFAVAGAAVLAWAWAVYRRTMYTPLQALTLLNEKTFVEAARNLGQRLLQEGGETMDEQVEFGFRIAMARSPNERERVLLKSAYQEYRDAYEEDLTGAEQLISVGESEAIASLDPRDLAAATALSNVLLNLDEAMTKE